MVGSVICPVITASDDPLWLGARKGSSNTAEVTAIGEACRWLSLHERVPPNHPRRAILFFDSHCACGVSARLTKAKDNNYNIKLVDKVASLVVQVRRHFKLDFDHARDFLGIYGNETADGLAERGLQGRVSPHATRWTEPLPAPGP